MGIRGFRKNSSTRFDVPTTLVLSVVLKWKRYREDTERNPELVVAGTITNASVVQDVLSTFGAPQSVDIKTVNGNARVEELLYSATGYTKQAQDAAEQAAAEKKAADERESGKIAINTSTKPGFYVIDDTWDYVRITFNTDSGAIESIYFVNPVL